MSKKCIKCKITKERKDYLDSGGWTCNECFAPQKKVIALQPGDPLIYVSPSNKDVNKNPVREEVTVVNKAYKAGSRWYIDITTKNAQGSSKVMVAYTEAI